MKQNIQNKIYIITHINTNIKLSTKAEHTSTQNKYAQQKLHVVLYDRNLYYSCLPWTSRE